MRSTRWPIASAVTAASSATGRSEVPAVTSAMRPFRGAGIEPTTSIRASGNSWTFLPGRRVRTAFAVDARIRVASTVRCVLDSLSRIAEIWASVFPAPYTASGNPRRIERCVSTVANPSSSNGSERRDSIASPTLTVPAFSRRRMDSTWLRSMGPASADLLPLLELQDRAQRAAPLDLLADAVLPLEDVERAVRHLDRELLRHDDDPGLVPHDPVPRADDLPAALNLAPDVPVALRLPRVGHDVAGEAREVDLEDRVDVPGGPVNHDARHALHLTRVAS